MPKTKTATTLHWRTFNPETYGLTPAHGEAPIATRLSILQEAQVLGPCTIIEKKNAQKKIIQRVEINNGTEIPNAPTSLAILAHDARQRQLIIILPPEMDKYLLALPRSGLDNITITNEIILFTQSRDHTTFLHTQHINHTDLDLLKQAIKHWTGQ